MTPAEKIKLQFMLSACQALRTAPADKVVYFHCPICGGLSAAVRLHEGQRRGVCQRCKIKFFEGE